MFSSPRSAPWVRVVWVAWSPPVSATMTGAVLTGVPAERATWAVSIQIENSPMLETGSRSAARATWLAENPSSVGEPALTMAWAERCRSNCWSIWACWVSAITTAASALATPSMIPETMPMVCPGRRSSDAVAS